MTHQQKERRLVPPAMGRNVVCRDAEIELCVLEIVEKRIIPVFGPRLQRHAKLLHEGCSIKLDLHDADTSVSFSPIRCRHAEKRGREPRTHYDRSPLLHGFECAGILLLL